MSGEARGHSMARADVLCLVAYAIALGAAVLAARALDGRGPIWIAAGADLAATIVVFGFSFAFDNSSFYDPYWSVAPVPIALYYAARAMGEGGAPGVPAIGVITLVTIWAVRLTWNWRRGWSGLGHEDWRYRNFRETTGRAYWLVSFSGIHVFPTVQVFLGCLPLFPALAARSRPTGILDVVALAITATAILIEGVADQQLRAFVRSGPAPTAILDRGLWAWSRHPNYFGEILFWWGLYLCGLAANPEWWWTGVGALAITAMFAGASVPMIDKRMAARRPAYAERMKAVSALVPWPARKR